MVNFLASEGTNLVGGDFGHGDGPSVIGGEFDLVTVAAFIDVDDRSTSPAHYSSNALKPACAKWWSPVSASVSFSSVITANDMQSVSGQSLSGRCS